MKVLIEVIKDLWEFFIGGFLPSGKAEKPAVSLSLPPRAAKLLIRDKKENPKLPLFEKELLPSAAPLNGNTAYVAVANARLFHRPLWTFDGVVRQLAYSQKVQVLEFSGRFARVACGDNFGWLLKEEITTSAEDIFPTLKSGEIYLHDSPETMKIRKYLADAFFTVELFMPLQAVELVTYRLHLQNHTLPWPNRRPRIAGDWQNLLKGQPGVQVGIYPKTGAVMEYSKTDGVGYLGYTKAVHIDESIVVESVGKNQDGQYLEETFTKEEWIEWRPVWISFT
jgi:hypothetical protein